MVTILLILMKVAINFPSNRPANTIDRLEIRESGTGHALRRTEMEQERLFPFCADAGDFIERRCRYCLCPARPVGPDRKAVRFVPESLQEIEYRIARLQHDRRSAGAVKMFASGIAIRTLCNPQEVDIVDSKIGKNLLGN